MLISIKDEEIQHFSGKYKPRNTFFLLINVKMPTVVGILTFMSKKKIMLNRAEYEIFFFITLGPGAIRRTSPMCFLSTLINQGPRL